MRLEANGGSKTRRSANHCTRAAPDCEQPSPVSLARLKLSVAFERQIEIAGKLLAIGRKGQRAFDSSLALGVDNTARLPIEEYSPLGKFDLQIALSDLEGRLGFGILLE